jgi:hypothetical protein
MKRIEIPAMFLLEVTKEELWCLFDLIGADGAVFPPPLLSIGEQIVLARRRSDNKVFRPAPFQPRDAERRDLMYFVEV